MFKKILLSCSLIICLSLSVSAAFVASPVTPETILIDPALTEMFAADGEQITMDDFLALTPRDIREKTGKKLGFQKSIALKMAQRKIAKQLKNANAEAPAGGDKNQLVALLLAIFLGGLGIHSFYQGKTLKGIGQLLLALTSWLIIPGIILGAWVLYDIITIALGSQTPKDGVWNPEL